MNLKRMLMKCISSVSNITRCDNKIDFETVPTIYCSKNSIEHIASSNNIIAYKIGEERFYFKECREHNIFPEYIETVISDYFKYVCRYNNSDYIHKIICDDLKIEENIEKFFTLNLYCEINYDVIKHYTNWDTAVIGLPTLFEKMQSDYDVHNFMDKYFPEFIRYVRNEIDLYHMNDYVKRDGYQLFRSSASIATKKMAELIGISDMVPDVYYIRLRIDNDRERFGIVTATAPGICPLDLSNEEKRNFSPNFQRQLLNMNLFDVICFQRDHKQENYFVVRDNEKTIVDVCAFDNDAPSTFFPLPTISADTCVKCSPMFVRGKYNRPYIDAAFVDKILALDCHEVREVMTSYLSKIQIQMLIIRIKKIKRSLRKIDIKKRITADKWNHLTIEKEISGKYGKTYLKHYLECDEIALVNDIMNHNI